MVRTWLLPLTLAVLACGKPSPSLRLSELPDPSVFVSASTGANSTGAYHLLPRLMVGIGTSATDCPQVWGATGTFNGVDLGTVDPGGYYYSLDAKGDVCDGPGFHLSDNHRAQDPAAPPKVPDLTVPVGELRIVDGEVEWIAEVFSLCAPRTLTQVSPAGAIRAGDEVALQWSPATDVLEPERILIRQEGSEEVAARIDPVTVEGSLLKFKMPALPVAGKFTLQASGVELFFAGTGRCEGFTSCRARCFELEATPATIDFVL